MTFYRADRIVRESAPALLVLLLVNLAAGQILNANAEVFLTLPFLLILVPVLNGVGGNVGTVLGSRLTSGLYTGTITMRGTNPGLRRQIRDAVVLFVLVFLVLGVLIYALSFGIGVVPPFGLEVVLFVILASGLMLAGVLIVATLGVAAITFTRGLDPDNFITPVITTLGDLLGVGFLVLVLGVIL